MSLRPHVVIPLDASDRDLAALRLAAVTAGRTGAAITLALPRTPKVLQRLSAYATGESLPVPDAADAYVEGAAERLRREHVAVEAVSWPSTDAPGEIASYARRLGADLVLVAGERRRGWRPSTATRLTTRSSVPVLVVPPQDVPAADASHDDGVLDTLLTALPLAQSA